MNILITGALGFVGVSLVRTLAAQEDVHVIATDVREPDAATIRFLQTVQSSVDIQLLDVTDRTAVHDLFAARPITHVLHAAALTPTRVQERERSTQIVDVNLGGAVNVLDAARQTDSVERVLTVSSSGVYGGLDNSFSDASAQTKLETDPLALDKLYGITKYSVERLAWRYGQLHGKPVTSVRLGPIYGPLERPSQSRPRISVIGQLLTAWREGRSVTVAGPTARRDWTHAADVAGAIDALFRAPQWRYDVYNVSCGVAVSLREVVDGFVQRGLSVEWIDEVERADIAMTPGQERLPLDITRLQEDAGFAPRYDVAAGVADCIKEPQCT